MHSHWLRALVAGYIVLVLANDACASEPDAPPRQSIDDAWWTGPILAAGASTLPQGHALIEPYLYDVIRYARFDDEGRQHDVERSRSIGSLTYLLYGVTDDFTIGAIPVFGYTDAGGGNRSSGVQAGDLTLQAQYRLAQFSEARRLPAISFVLQQTLPTGQYDRLGERPGDGFGAGAWTTTLALYSQYYFWMPTGRILRTRLNFSYAFAGDVDVRDVSVYGTDQGFRGGARPGDVLTINSSWEYSITRHWVFAFDFIYLHDEATRVSGTNATGEPIAFDSGPARRFGIAPALEYNWNSRIGILFGARWFGAGKNTSATVTPVVAVNMVY